jgi:hypothetical protein
MEWDMRVIVQSEEKVVSLPGPRLGFSSQRAWIFQFPVKYMDEVNRIAAVLGGVPGLQLGMCNPTEGEILCTAHAANLEQVCQEVGRILAEYYLSSSVAN